MVLDTAVGDDGAPVDTTAPTVPGRPAGTSPSTSSIQITWAASTDASLPITYRIYRDGGATVGRFDHHHVVHRHRPGRRFEPHLHGRCGGRLNNASAKSQASLRSR